MWSYVFLCLTYMQSCLDTLFCCCIANIVNVMSKVGFFRKLNKTPSPLLSDGSLMLGIVKPGTGQGWAAQFTLTQNIEVSLFIFFLHSSTFGFLLTCLCRSDVLPMLMSSHTLMHKRRLSCLNSKGRLNLALSTRISFSCYMRNNKDWHRYCIL